MQYSKIFKRAFDIVRHEPALWIVGIIMAIFGGAGGGSGSFNSSGNFGDGNGFEEDLANQFPTDLPPWFNMETLLPIAVLIVCLIIAWSLFSFAMRNVALAGLVYGSDRASVGQDVRWGELLRFGWSRHALRLMGLNFLLALPALIFFFSILIIGGLIALSIFEPLMSGVGGEPSFEGIGAVIGGIVLMVCLGLIIGLISWILSLVGQYAARFIVLDGDSIMDGIRNGWALLRNNVGHTFVVAIILIALSFIVGIIVSIFFILLALATVVPLVVLMISESLSLVVGIILVVLAVIFIVILSSILYGPLLAYIQTVWTLVWQELTKDNDEGEIMLDEALA